ncbi:Nif3-like dinuclear metal center hexameric protein, partial [Mycobacterium sp. ITM-2017-0098]
AQVPDGGLLLAHHPLLLRGVDTVSADTAKGALVHGLIRTRRAVGVGVRREQRASPGVSDALADVLGLQVTDVLSAVPSGPALDKWVVFVPAENS